LSKPKHVWSYKQRGSETELGPVSEAQFVALVKNGTISGSTLVRSPTRTKNNWVAAKRISAVAKLIKPPTAEPPTAEPPTAESALEPPKNNPPIVAAAPTVDEEPIVGTVIESGEPAANPFSSPGPGVVADASHGPPIDAQKIREQFKPLSSTAVAWLLRITLFVMAINGLCLLCFIIWGYSRVPSIQTAQMAVFIIQLILVILTAIFFFMWKYRAYANLQATCVNKLKSSAGWCVGVYFIPILNLFSPAVAMHEIQSRSKAKIGASVIIWWILMMVSSIMERVAWAAPGAPENKAGHVLSIASICLTIIAGYLLLRIIRTVTEKQRRYWLWFEQNSKQAGVGHE